MLIAWILMFQVPVILRSGFCKAKFELFNYYNMMLERQDIDIIDSNSEYCIFFPKSNDDNKLEKINAKLSPVSAIVSALMLYDAFTKDNSDSMIIGSTLAIMAGFGFRDLVIKFKDQNQGKK